MPCLPAPSMILALFQARGPATARVRAAYLPSVGISRIGYQLERMGDEAAVGFALLQLEAAGKAISVTFGGRKKEQRTLYMTPQQARTIVEVIRRKVRPGDEIAKILQQGDRP